MKKIIAVGFVLLGAFVLVGCEQKQTDLEVYQNEELGFELEMPSGVSVKNVENDEYNRLVEFGGVGSFSVRIKEVKDTLLNEYHYLDLFSTSTSILGGREALIFEGPNGYCDGPGCTVPFIAYVVKDGDDFYILSFDGDVEIDDAEESVVSSFKFIK
jgi:hypothetical protein